MPNALSNAAFLELADGWSGVAPLTLAVDETVRGAAGRAVLFGYGTADSGATLYLRPTAGKRAAVTAGSVLDVAGFVVAYVAGVPVTPAARAVFYNSGGTQVDAQALPVQPAALAQHGEGLAGVSATFRRAYARLTAPAGAVAVSVEFGAAATTGQSVEVRLLKPYVGAVPYGRTSPLPWTPGLHTQADLQLDAWPDILRPFQSGGGSEPRPSRIEFEAGPGRPSSRRSAFDPARRFTGLVRCDGVERAALEAFHRSGPSDFYFVEPDSDRLCVASWAADGAPRMAESRGLTVMMDVGLWLETA